MQLQEVLEKRRSIREYQDRPVEKEKIQAIIQAATLAPSWKNSQVSRYYVITGPQTLRKVKAALPEFNQKSVEKAPVLIVTTFVTGRSGFATDGKPDNEVGDGWGCYDCGMQNENLLLKATELGLATLVMGIRDGGKLREILQIPVQEEVMAVVGLGYSNAAPRMPRRKMVEEISRFFEE